MDPAVAAAAEDRPTGPTTLRTATRCLGAAVVAEEAAAVVVPVGHVEDEEGAVEAGESVTVAMDDGIKL